MQKVLEVSWPVKFRGDVAHAIGRLPDSALVNIKSRPVLSYHPHIFGICQMSQSYLLSPDSTLPPTLPPRTKNNNVRASIAGRDALAGAAGGITSVLLGQPFDLVKVRLQTTNSSDVLRVAKNIWVHEGPLAFYKGAAVPLLGVGICVSIQFTVFHRCRQAFEALNVSSPHAHEQRLSEGQAYLAGGAAGATNSIISGPVEHIRTRLQLQPYGDARLYKGPWDCIRQIVRQAGLSGLYKAYPVAFFREFQAYGCYFAAFEASIRTLGQIKGKERKQMSTLEVMPCGALAGIAFWVGSYPIDVIKSKLQADGFGAQAKYRSAWAATVDTWRTGRFPGFWRGLSPTLARTSMSSAGCFAV